MEFGEIVCESAAKACSIQCTSIASETANESSIHHASEIAWNINSKQLYYDHLVVRGVLFSRANITVLFQYLWPDLSARTLAMWSKCSEQNARGISIDRIRNRTQN